MNTSDEGDKGIPLDTESIMREVREQIVSRTLSGQSLRPPSNASLPDDFYDELYQAALVAGRLGVKMEVVQSHAPIVGPMFNRLRRMAHELVTFYVNRLADQQLELNTHLFKALNLLRVTGSEPGGPAMKLPAIEPDQGDRATMEDVFAAYRLLLGRDPDPDGLHGWGNLVRNHYVTRDYLVDSFLSTPEFKTLQAGRNEPQLVDLSGFKMFVRMNDNFIGAVIGRQRRYEPHVTAVLGSLLKRNATFVDVGANIGYFTLLAAAAVGPNGRVFAYEPNPANCELLRRSIAANGFEDRVTLREAAVAEAAQTLRFWSAGVNTNGHIVNPGEALASRPDVLTVEAVALDDVLQNSPRVDVIKMDVEGAEARVWQGMQAIITQHRPAIVFEYSPTLLERISAVAPEAFLEQLRDRYDLFIILPAGDMAAAPDSVETIVQRHADSGLTHLDILARPRR